MQFYWFGFKPQTPSQGKDGDFFRRTLVLSGGGRCPESMTFLLIVDHWGRIWTRASLVTIPSRSRPRAFPLHHGGWTVVNIHKRNHTGKITLHISSASTYFSATEYTRRWRNIECFSVWPSVGYWAYDEPEWYDYLVNNVNGIPISILIIL